MGQKLQARLPLMALEALEEIGECAREGRPPRTKTVALCLAYLCSLHGGDRWPFYEFWRWLDCEDRNIRSANVQRCLNAIYLHVGVDRATKRLRES